MPDRVYTARNVSRRGYWLISIGLTAVFVLQLIGFGGIGIQNEARLGYQRYVTVAWILTLMGAFLVGVDERAGFFRNSGVRRWIVWYVPVLLIMIGRSVALEFGLGGSYFEIIVGLVTQSLLYATPILIFPVGMKLLENRLFQRTIAIHASAGGIYALWAILTKGLANRVDYLNLDTGISFSAGLPLYAFPVATLLLPYLSRMLKILVSFGALGWIAYAITFQSRLTSVIVILVFVALIFGALREHREKKKRGGLFEKWYILAIVAGIVVALAYLLRNKQISEGLAELDARWEARGSITSTTLEDERYDEAFVVASNMTLWDWLIGRGVAGTWSDPRMYDGEVRTMVHFGYLHFIFIGGIGLGILLTVVPLFAVCRAWRGAREIEYIAVAIVGIRVIELIGYGVPQLDPPWLLTCVCLGCVISSRSRKKEMAAFPKYYVSAHGDENMSGMPRALSTR